MRNEKKVKPRKQGHGAVAEPVSVSSAPQRQPVKTPTAVREQQPPARGDQRREPMRFDTLLLVILDRGIEVWNDKGRLRVCGLPEDLTPEIQHAIRRHERALLRAVSDQRRDGRTWLKPKAFWQSFWALRPEWHIDARSQSLQAKPWPSARKKIESE